MDITMDIVAFIDRAIAELETRMCLKIDALREEYKKSERLLEETRRELEKRLEEMNGFREQLGKQATTFMTAKDTDEKINLALANRNATIVSIQTQAKVMWALLAALILLFVGEYLRR